jgi:hypothetical protein
MGYLGHNQPVCHHLFSGRYYYVDDIIVKGKLAALDAVITGGTRIHYFAQRLRPLDFSPHPGAYEPH